jgi:glycosyltransferase involved in cell wall biosynthesis
MNPLSIIIPVYNEYFNLEKLMPGIIGYCQSKCWDIIIVNDGSNDGSGELLQQFSTHDHVAILNHKLNKGYGATLKTGFSACNTEYAITFDADGQHALEDIDKLFHMITSRDADLVVGSRKGAETSSYYRGIGKGFIRYLAKILMTVPIYDLNSGMKIYRTELAKKYLNLLPDTMAFSDIIALVFINNRHLVLEEPITVRERKHGKSAIGIETAFQTIMEVIHIVILFNPMKIFLPLALFCFFLTGLWGIPLLLQGRGVSMGSLLGIITGILLFLLGLIAEQLSMIRRNQDH